MLTQEELKRLLHYDPETGVFTRLIFLSNRVNASSPVGCVNKVNGYHMFSVKGKIRYAHRMAWLYVYGYLPEQHTDRINGDRTDNRICNLRLASSCQNIRNSKHRINNTSGFKGVSFDKARGKWTAHAMVDRKGVHLGRYGTSEEAAEAYRRFTMGEYAEFYKKTHKIGAELL